MTAVDLPMLQPAEFLAAEELLLDAAESGSIDETLAFWEPKQHFVVLGYGNKASSEVSLSACKRLNVPVLRRISGGGTVLQGPGVLNYSLVLRIQEGSPLESINGANQFIMQRNAEALTMLVLSNLSTRGSTHPHPRLGGEQDAQRTVGVQGHTDLAIAGRKFSGNAQRRRRTHLLFHGAILLHLDLDLIEAVLPMPSLQPGYRNGRPHRDFLTQLALPADSVKQALRRAWSASRTASLDSLVCDWNAAIRRLVAEKYSREDWNYRI